ncbi:hypothetical protein BWQ96_08964 [Gracilariopsis chorda]|uniref:Uncharacterized protein n=1 Tax=Gracilariopsis chorda TaxID=448386 RepID=A0A2V3IGW8_9FLOR|nr:hypothetical protein BWQ96_08964 [Gracilariopsis chorda]|eukprot:PXF41317.1 hypothetical protein BWQ96_08964 [Gracilariopsis chorda]
MKRPKRIAKQERARRGLQLLGSRAHFSEERAEIERNKKKVLRVSKPQQISTEEGDAQDEEYNDEQGGCNFYEGCSVRGDDPCDGYVEEPREASEIAADNAVPSRLCTQTVTNGDDRHDPIDQWPWMPHRVLEVAEMMRVWHRWFPILPFLQADRRPRNRRPIRA